MAQLLLFPDPRPLVERLGQDFFRQAPEVPGVYLMRDAADTVIYVGKAKNLRKRLANYRVANPERLRRRQLRLLRAVARIELQECPSEASALAREAELLRGLRPRFNRAGTWPGPARFLGWRAMEEGLNLEVTRTVEPGWFCHGPFGAGAIPLRGALARLCWWAIHPERGLAGMPAGGFRGSHEGPALIPRHDVARYDLEESVARLNALAAGHADEFAAWVRERTARQNHPFELAMREADLEIASELARPQRGGVVQLTIRPE